MKWFRLYDWVLHWADTPYATPALGILAFAESSFFPPPPDPLLMALALSKPKRAFFYATVCSACSVVGGLVGYAIGSGAWHLVGDFFFQYLGPIGFTPDNFEAVRLRYEANAFLAIFAAGFTPIPYKVFTVAAGVFSISLAPFFSLPCSAAPPGFSPWRSSSGFSGHPSSGSSTNTLTCSLWPFLYFSPEAF